MTEKRWSYSGGVIVGTDICENGIPHTNRSVVTHLNKYEREIEKLKEENGQLKEELNSFKPVVFQDTTNNGTILLYAKEYGVKND